MTRRYEERMLALGQYTLAPEGSELRRAAEIAALDIRVRQTAEANWKTAVARAIAQHDNGAGQIMDQTLRGFTAEYNHRCWHHGINPMSLSFNILEAFHEYNPQLAYFSLFGEVDHIFSVPAFLDFATRQSEVKVRMDILNHMENNVIYSFNVCNSLEEQIFSTVGGGSFVLGGVSLVRHDSEISVVMVAGEEADLAQRTQFAKFVIKHSKPTPQKLHIRPAKGLKTRAESLLGNKKYQKTLVLSRIDIQSIPFTFDVRYILRDDGTHYDVVTDDRTTDAEADLERLKTYTTLFELIPTLLMLPLYFSVNKKHITIEKVQTELFAKRKTAAARQQRPFLTSHETLDSRKIKVLDREVCAQLSLFSSPQTVSKSTGHWKTLQHDEVGVDKSGNITHGKTWVEQRYVYAKPNRGELIKATRRLEMQEQEEAKYPNRGYLYVLRCPAHAENVFKVGLTRRSVEERVRELSGKTETPVPFLPVVSFWVSDCDAAERTAHAALANFRVASEREFFRLSSEEIIAVVGDVAKQYSRPDVEAEP